MPKANWSDLSPGEIVASAIMFVIFFGYFFYYFGGVYRYPTRFNLGRNMRARVAWVRSMMTTGPDLIVAVQTIRNTIMASTFVATIVSTVGFYVISLGFDERDSGNNLRSDQLMIMAASLLFSFLNMSYTVRLSQHLAFLMGSRKLDAEVYRRIVEFRRAASLEAEKEDLHKIVFGEVYEYVPRGEGVEGVVVGQEHEHNQASSPKASLIVRSFKADPELNHMAEIHRHHHHRSNSHNVEEIPMDTFATNARVQKAPDVPAGVFLDEIRFANMASCEKLVARLTLHYFLGLRLLFFAIVVSFWIVHSYAGLGCSVVLVLMLSYTDHSVSSV